MDDSRKDLVEKVGIFALHRAQKSFMKGDIAQAERRGERLGLLLYRLDRKHRERTFANLELAFPEWTPERRHQVGMDVFRHWGRAMADFMRSPNRTREEVLNSVEIAPEDLAYWQGATGQGKGVIAVTAHIGNFERFGHWSVASGRPLTVVARDANQGGVQDEVAKIRAAAGMETLSRGQSARAILQKLRQNELIGILPDQNAGDCFPNFFGKPCGTVLGPAVLALRTGAPILPAFCVRVGVGRYRAIVRPTLEIDRQAKDPVAIMAQFNEVLESVIRDYPDQYLWMHDRWKSARRRGLL